MVISKIKPSCERLEVYRVFVELPIAWDYMGIDEKDVGRNRLQASRGIDLWNRRIVWRG